MRQRRVKVLATIGPASANVEMIRRLFDAGADVFRINMSHATHDEARALHRMIRRVEAETGRPIGVLGDLQGPKLRIGDIAGGAVELLQGAEFTLDQDEAEGDLRRVFLPHRHIFESVKVGQPLLLDDGKLHLRVIQVDPSRIVTEVEVGGSLASRKGISLPVTILPIGALTDKDRHDLEFAAELGVDWLALSFVQRVDDVAEARKLTRGRAAIMAKIEKPSAVEDFDHILEMSDGIMIARGDLGVEMPVEQVPGIQKRITWAARQAGKPVVVATQMLESMIQAPVPTRAEVSDVATAVYDGADAIMLSAESAVGAYPEQAVATMDKIAQQVEREPHYAAIMHSGDAKAEATSADAISAAARSVAETLKLAAIICYSASGATGQRVARERPKQPILGLTPIASTSRRLALVWGLHCVLTHEPSDLDEMIDRACRIAFQQGFARPGQRILVICGVPLGTPGATNMLRVAFVGDDGSIRP